MSSVTASAAQLDEALDRLERAVDSLFEQSGNIGLMRKELTAMVEDRERLAAELDASRAREAELQSLADEASEALGSAIAEVRAALGRDGVN
ncbi:MAG: DUF4164 family protein [Pseudomonadota bacterium]